MSRQKRYFTSSKGIVCFLLHAIDQLIDRSIAYIHSAARAKFIAAPLDEIYSSVTTRAPQPRVSSRVAVAADRSHARHPRDVSFVSFRRIFASGIILRAELDTKMLLDRLSFFLSSVSRSLFFPFVSLLSCSVVPTGVNP